jgi:hypothetical protein
VSRIGLERSAAPYAGRLRRATLVSWRITTRSSVHVRLSARMDWWTVVCPSNCRYMRRWVRLPVGGPSAQSPNTRATVAESLGWTRLPANVSLQQTGDLLMLAALANIGLARS